MLKWGDPFLFGVLIPLGILTLLALIPYIFPQPNEAEIGSWFPKSNRLIQGIVALLGITIIILTFMNR